MTNNYIKPPMEVRYKDELNALKNADTGRKSENWMLSPKAVRPLCPLPCSYVWKKVFLHDLKK